jgi:hypothetical protein
MIGVQALGRIVLEKLLSALCLKLSIIVSDRYAKPTL